MEFRQFASELKTRKVYRTAAVYGAGAWAVLQVADVIFPVVGLPDWTITAVLVMAALGFPLALLLSWLFEVSPEGRAVLDNGEHSASTASGTAHVIEFTLILLLCGLVGYLYWGRLTEPDAPAVPPVADASIAVMPFVNLSNNENLEYLGDGLAEEILNLLAKLNEINVAARTSSFYFKGKDVDIRTVGQRLGVQHVLEGSVRPAGNRVRVTAQLITSADGFHLWSETYDRELTDLLEIQDEIAREVVEQLQLYLSPESEGLLARRSAASPEAYDYYLRAQDYMRRPPDIANLNYALGLYGKAIDADQKFADAYAGSCVTQLGLYEIDRDRARFQQAETACQKALTLDRRAASVYIALGRLYLVSGQHQRAVEEFDLALALGTREEEAYLGLGASYQAMGDLPKAEEHYLAAIAGQPNDWRAQMAMARFLLETGRLQESLDFYLRVTELMPDSSLALNNLGAAYFMLGDFSDASEAWRQSLALAPSAAGFSNMATSLFLAGDYDTAVTIYNQALEYTPDDYELWGYLADAYRESKNTELAKPMYENAIRLAADRLAVTPEDTHTLALMAHYKAHLGNATEAQGYIARVKGLQAEDARVDYSLATALSALGDNDAALASLRRAVEKGYPSHMAAVDANLRQLWHTPELQAMTAQRN